MLKYPQESGLLSHQILSKNLIYLGLGSNLGNRLENLREAINLLSEFSIFEPLCTSHVIETSAILTVGSPPEWNLPYLNMIIVGTSKYGPQDLLSQLKHIERRMGRNLAAAKWSPRIIDIDILDYMGQETEEEFLKIPHPEIKNRDFIKYSLAELGWHRQKPEQSKQSEQCERSQSAAGYLSEIEEDVEKSFENFKPLNHFVLYPKFAGIINVTPDSFSDGGHFLQPNRAIEQISALVSDGASMLDIGAQSTKPGYKEISTEEEISRIEEVLKRCQEALLSLHDIPISLDTYFDEVLEYAVRAYPGLISCANVQQFRLQERTIKMLAYNNIKIIVMLHGTDLNWFDSTIKKLENWGMQRSNIIIDPGIGFQKTKLQNIEFIRNLQRLKQFGTEIMLGHSRKSFISSFSTVDDAAERDLETIAISEMAYENKAADYIRVHNVKDHMRFFVAKKMMQKPINNM